MAGISKNEAVLRRATKAVAEIYGKDSLGDARAAVDKVAKFIGGLSDIGFSAFKELSSGDAATVIAKAAKAERDAAKAARKAAKSQQSTAAAAE